MNRTLTLTVAMILFYAVAPGHLACARGKHPPNQEAPQTECWHKASTQLAMNECAASDWKQADAELSITYQQVLSQYSNDPRRIAQIRKAEVAWLAFRDAEISALFPESSRSERGSASTMCRAMRLTRLTVERTKALKALIEHKEGDVCAPY
jgi:uncharacterized protein YecT (DUF1311 family)